LIARLPKPKLQWRKQKALPPPVNILNCPECGKPNAADANFCQYCGRSLAVHLVIDAVEGSAPPPPQDSPT
jgi:predicted amidophosphoribosyltransferase